MGLFDRIKGDTEEVELRVPHGEPGTDRNTARRTPRRSREETGGEAGEDEERFLLPGMSPQAVQEPEEDEPLPGRDEDLKELLGRIVRQNERIIRLLEDGEDGTDAGIDGIL